MKKIGVTFVPGARTRTLRDQRKSWLRVLLFDALAYTSTTVTTVADAGTSTTNRSTVMVHTMIRGKIAGSVRISRQ